MPKKILSLAALLCLALLPGIAAATVTGTNTNSTFTCAASTGPYAFTFPAFDLSGVDVIETTAAGVQTVLPSTAYIGTPVNNSYMNGGSVTLQTACPNGDTLTIQRTTEQTQLSAFTEYMPALYQTFESGLDKLTMEVQDTVPRALKLNIGSQYTNLSVPDPVPGDILQWNTAGTGLQNINPVTYPATFTALSQCTPYAYAGLPPTPPTGTCATLTDGIRGTWVYQGRWHSVTGAANIQDFGAIPDSGTTDNSAAIQAAINAALAADTYAIAPPAATQGAYYKACGLTAILTVRYQGFGIAGGGSGSHILCTTAAGTTLSIDGSGAGGGNGSQIFLSNIAIGASAAAQDALVLRATNFSTFNNLMVTGAGRYLVWMKDVISSSWTGGGAVAGVWAGGGGAGTEALRLDTASNQGSNGNSFSGVFLQANTVSIHALQAHYGNAFLGGSTGGSTTGIYLEGVGGPEIFVNMDTSGNATRITDTSGTPSYFFGSATPGGRAQFNGIVNFENGYPFILGPNGGNQATFVQPSFAANRTMTFPDATGTLVLEGAKDTGISTGVGSVKMKGTNAANNIVWLPIVASDGVTYWVPGWTTNNP